VTHRSEGAGHERQWPGKQHGDRDRRRFRHRAGRFAGEGANLVIADINAEAARAVVAEIEAAGSAAVAVTGDLSDKAVADRVVSTAVETFGGLDVLVNNAGIPDSLAAAADVTDAEWDRVIGVNLTAPFLLTRAALPHMLARGKGAIVNTASEAALRGSAAGTVYTVSKHGLVGLTRSVAVMYRNCGIRANAIAPGLTATHIGDNITMDHGAHGIAAIAGYLHNAGRTAEADEPAAVIVFLASDAASNINGVILPVDNGWAAV
jgi:NAD(P)-dependent dehydrogenase (short-subunit alcohol dehydrogenase family)